MLFISCSPGYKLLGIRKTKPNHHPATGELISTDPPINAEFYHGGAPSWAIDQALGQATFQAHWTGLPPEQEQRAMVSSYDTDQQAEALGWDQETKEYVEQFMLKWHDHGDWYIRAVPPEETLAIPWPAYDSTHHMQIANIAQEIGVDLEYVIQWETTHKNRDKVLRDLQEALDKQGDPEPLVAA